MFEEDVDLEETVDFSTGEVVVEKKPTLKLKMLRFLTMPKTCLTMIKTVTYLTMMISTQTKEIKDYFDKYTIQYRIEALE